jgi:hypothetical protein
MGAWRQDGLADSYVGRNVTLTLTVVRDDEEGTVSDETVMCGYWPSVSLVRSLRAHYTKWKQAIVTNERTRIKSGHGPQRGAQYQDELVDWLSAARRTPTPEAEAEAEAEAEVNKR